MIPALKGSEISVVIIFLLRYCTVYRFSENILIVLSKMNYLLCRNV